MPAPADYDGDGRVDPAVWEQGYCVSGTCVAPQLTIAGQPALTGVSADFPIPARYAGGAADSFAGWQSIAGGTWQWRFADGTATASPVSSMSALAVELRSYLVLNVVRLWWLRNCTYLGANCLS
jgi:hypothetical protein